MEGVTLEQLTIGRNLLNRLYPLYLAYAPRLFTLQAKKIYTPLQQKGLTARTLQFTPHPAI